jgi:hypothetical protein
MTKFHNPSGHLGFSWAKSLRSGKKKSGGKKGSAKGQKGGLSRDQIRQFYNR